MSDVLVVYFSRTGYTRRVAEEIARTVGGDLEEIRDSTKRSGFLGYWRCAREALKRTAISVEPPKLQPRDYRVVVLGTPVWASHVSSPMRAYIAANRNRFAHIALFCTQGGSGAKKVLQDMMALCASVPLATAAFDDREIDSGAHSEKMRQFLRALARPADAAGAAPRSGVEDESRFSMRRELRL